MSSILIPYFLASNGYAGFDISVIRYNSYHIIFWYKILTSKITTEKEKAIAGNEIKYFFYNWIGAFYSCKEKLLSFIGAEVENKSIVFKKTCLSADGQKAIKELFSKNNKLIEIFNIRNRVIHDAYDMEIDHEKNTIRIKHFGFTLTSEKDQRSSAYSYKIDDLNVANRYNDMEKLLEDYVCIIQKTTNINTDSFRRKFINKDGNFEMYI